MIMKILKKILNYINPFTPNYPYSEEWDYILNGYLDKYNFTKCTDHTAMLGDIKVWVANHPYASFTPYECLSNLGKVSASRDTIDKAHKKYIKAWKEQRNAPIESYVNFTHSTNDIPDGFYDFTGGVNIDKSTVLEWIEKSDKMVLDYLMNNEGKEKSTYCKSGNTVVITHGNVYEQEGREVIYINTMVVKRYSEKTQILDKYTLEKLF